MERNWAKDVRAWVSAANMGLGHKRAVQPLKDIAEGGIIIANDPAFTDPDELKVWEKMLSVYESLSRVKKVPLIGNLLFGIMDYFQKIRAPYPRVDLSYPTIQTKFVDNIIAKGLCKTLVRTVKSKPLPAVTSFFQNAIACDKAGHGRIYCIICDADINRVWVASDPRTSRIVYLVPCGAAMRRLKQYGVPDERIFMTGFPLPLELLGNEELDVLKRDLGERLRVLDPTDRFRPLHGNNVEHFLGAENFSHERPTRPLGITFAVGGAGAQKEIAVAAMKSLGQKIRSGEIAMNLVCGVRAEVRDFFVKAVAEVLPDCPNVRIIFGSTDKEYFDSFNACLHTTDVLWTKPSELSFYSGLGIPVLMAPTIGSQEEFNKRWLDEIQAGIPQEDPEYTVEWFYELLEQGRFAEAAWDGFLKARKYGTYKIFEILKTGTMERESNPLKR